MSNTAITALVGGINFATTFGGLFFLMCIGRKIIFIVGGILMTITLGLLSYFSFDHNTIGMITCTLLFIAWFEFSTGTVLFPYIAEIMHDKAIGIAMFLNWFMALIMSVSIPFIVKSIQIGWIFAAFSIFALIGTILNIIWLEETRGKT